MGGAAAGRVEEELAGPAVEELAGPEAVARVAPVVAGVALVAEVALPAAAAVALPVVAEVALPVVPAGRVERAALGEQAAVRGPAPLAVVVVRPGPASAAVGRPPEEAVARGQPVAAPEPERARVQDRPEVVAGPGLPGWELPVPGTEVGEVLLETHPAREAQAIRVARPISPY